MRQHYQAGHSNRRRLIAKLAAYTATTTGALAACEEEALTAIVYTDLGSNGITVREGIFEIDLNVDGLVDFVLLHHHFAIYPTSSDSRSFVEHHNLLHISAPTRAYQSLGIHTYLSWQGSRNAKAFRHNDMVAPSAANLRSVLVASSFSTSSGTRGRGDSIFFSERAFLGVSIETAFQSLNAGWIEIDARDVAARSLDSFTIYGFAYETVPGKSIAAGAVPEPPSLVLLAAGAAGLAAWRRNRTKQGQS